MKKLLYIFIFIFSIGDAYSQCISNDSNIFTFNYNNHLYTLVKENKNWADAAACAKLMNGYLAEINSEAEMTKINEAINTGGKIDISKTVAPDGGGASYIWLGGNDSKTEGDWVWNGNNDSNELLFFRGVYPSGLPINGAYVNWGQEPDNYNNAQDGLGLAISNWPLGTAGHWNDINTNNLLYYLVEMVVLGNDEITFESQIQLFPNPACDKATIELPHTNKMFTISISDITGKSIEFEQQITSTTQIDLATFESGLYFIKLTSTDNSISCTRKFQIVK